MRSWLIRGCWTTRVQSQQEPALIGLLDYWDQSSRGIAGVSDMHPYHI
jgi:hypothetical protein